MRKHVGILALALCGAMLLCGCGGAAEKREPELIQKDIYTFSDGEKASLWRYPMDVKAIYQLDNGTQLLAEADPIGPENTFYGNLESLQDLDEEAQSQIIAFYREMGLQYDVEDYLEKAYREYRSDAENFSCYLLQQETYPDGSNDTLIYFTSRVTLPQGGQTVAEYSLTYGFDRATGKVIDGWSLFSGSEAEVKAALLESLPGYAPALGDAFRPEYVRFSPEGYTVTFLPAGETVTSVWDETYSDSVLSVLNSWAIPSPRE